MRGPELTPLQFRTCRSLDDVALRHVEGRELRMRGLDHKSDGTLRACGAAPDLADVVFKTVRQVDPGRVLLAVTGLCNGLPAGLDPSRHAEPRRSRVDVEVDFGEDGVVIVSKVAENTWNRVAPGSVSRPLIIRSRASRCSGDAFASTIGATSWHFPYVGSELNWQGQP